MSPEAISWLAGVRAFASASRPSTAVPPAAVAAERSILAAHLVVWLDTEWPALLAERAATGGGDDDPAVVLTTSAAGIDAATEVLRRDDPLTKTWRDRFACVSERDYRLWCIRHPDPGHRLHVNHWSWIKTRVPPQRHAALARWPLAGDEAYWLHRTGTSGAGRERRCCRLWKWNGRIAVLLAPSLDDVAGL